MKFLKFCTMFWNRCEIFEFLHPVLKFCEKFEILYPVLKYCKIFVKVHLFVEKSNPKPVQNQLLDWMPKNHFQINQLPKKQFLGVKKQLLSVKNQLLDSKKLVLGKSTGWSKESFGHPIQKLVLDRFWITFFRQRDAPFLYTLF